MSSLSLIDTNVMHDCVQEITGCTANFDPYANETPEPIVTTYRIAQLITSARGPPKPNPSTGSFWENG